MARISHEEAHNDDDELVAVAEWVVTGVSGHPSNFFLLLLLLLLLLLVWVYETEGRQCCHILFF